MLLLTTESSPKTISLLEKDSPPNMNHITEPPTPDKDLELMDTQEGKGTENRTF